MRKPYVGILGEIAIERDGAFLGYEKSYATQTYVKSVLKAGGVPIVLPVIEDEDVTKEQIKPLNALIISGGYDVNPILYGQEPIGALGYIRPDRDIHDIYAIKYSFERKIPILGICKGIQVLNVAFGGTLYQDLSQIKGAIKHSQNAKPTVPTHTVKIEVGSKLHSVLGKEIMTNSFHHQAVCDVAEGFKVTARSKDNVIEAIEYNGDNFIVGVQWHPEAMADNSNEMLNLFKLFINNAK